QRDDDEILRDLGNIRKELIGTKRLVLTELFSIKQVLTTLADALLPPASRETIPMRAGDTVKEPTTGENSASAHVPAGASLTESSAPARQGTEEQPVLPDAQEPSAERGTKDEDDTGTGQ